MHFLIPTTIFLTAAFALPTTPNLTNATLTSREVDINQKSGMSITAFGLPGCKGIETINPNVQYDFQNQGRFRAYSISRDLDPAEQLDFSTGPLPAGIIGKRLDMPLACGTYFQSAASGTKKGCYTLDKEVQCFRLWHH